ncbi:hypothetical protein DK052_15530 [Salmonella enterica subsp. enterica]|nr:hypothetical protein [Salmonella enterica subsp. enterica serovar Orientalis]
MLTLRQPGMETRCPEGAGPGQRCWPGAKHDSPGSRREVARTDITDARQMTGRTEILSRGQSDHHQLNGHTVQG